MALEEKQKNLGMNCNGHIPCDELNLSSKELLEFPLCTLSLTNITRLNLNYNNIEELPEAVCEAFGSSLMYLFIKGNNLKQLPNNINLLKHLTVIDASENCIPVVPDSFVCLHQLEKVKLIGNLLKQLPSNIQGLESLSELYLDENKLHCLPERFGELQQLQRLEISNNKLKKLPDNFGNLKQLQYLNVGYNHLKDLPATMGALPNLEEVDFSFNRLRLLPSQMTSAPRLRKIFADNNTICLLPSWFSDLVSLEELSLRNNQLQDSPFPAEFGKVACKLRLFDLAGNYMESLPDSFGEMKHIESIHLGSCLLELERSAHLLNGNWIAKLPENFGHITMLKCLRIDENQLEELPESFGQLVHLESLDLGQNKLKRLPSTFGQLQNLKSCLLSRNFLERLPQNFGELKSLTELRLDNNLLEVLPESFKNLTQIQILDLFNNRLSEIPFFLQSMTLLRYLELDENNFGVSLQEVPRIIRRAIYADRDPKLKDDWRGRGRQDLNNFYHLAEEIENSSSPDNTRSDEAQKHFDVIVAALQQGSAIWRSHTQSGARVKFNHDPEQMTIMKHLPTVNASSSDNDDLSNAQKRSCLDTTNSQELSSSDEAEENWDSECCQNLDWREDDKMDCTNEEEDWEACHVENEEVISITAKEDWDAEIEQTNPFHVYDDFPVYNYRPRTVAAFGFHPKNAFCPADQHAKPIMRLKFGVGKIIQGQFDDADSS